MSGFFRFLFGNYNDRILKKYYKIVDVINSLESSISQLTDTELQNKTKEFRDQLSAGKTLDAILPEAFAVVREASMRVLGMRHFDVQLIGGMVLHDGKIAEMKTGEGKTLVATLPVYLNALTGNGVHVVTVNDYLARRDAQTMGQLYNFLQLSVGISTNGMFDEQKRSAYNADITYGTNHEFGFDYLRDNLKYSPSDVVLRPFNFAIVDEVDSILIDEARTPLIISGDADSDSLHLYTTVDLAIKSLLEEDYIKDEKHKNVHLTDSGNEKVELFLRAHDVLKSPHLYDISNTNIVYHINCALRANKMFKKDVDYIVHNGQVLIIDEYTGRILQGRRYSGGLHQAIEAKENVEIQLESQTIASITYQNLFRMYPKLAGMTGTAATEEAEFDEIYKLTVVSIPTNKPIQRIDRPDRIFTDRESKERAVIDLIKARREKNQPVLVGTCSLERSEHVSKLLQLEGIPHNVLNAKQHEKEAYVIAEAGTPGCVTIATNMAGRGTDIKLGGCSEMRVKLECSDIEDESQRRALEHKIKMEVSERRKVVLDAGGLLVIGMERNESRRIDDQLCGRSGRQGDPGESIFFFSLDDDLAKYYAFKPSMKIGDEGGELPFGSLGNFMSKRIKIMQNKVCAMNFDIRKQVIKYDDVINTQRKQIYEQRSFILNSHDVSAFVFEMMEDVIQNIVDKSDGFAMDVDVQSGICDELQKSILKIFGIEMAASDLVDAYKISRDAIIDVIYNAVKQEYSRISDAISFDNMQSFCKDAALHSIDRAWKEHLATLDFLRQGVNYSSYAQKNPINVYQFESFNLFNEMLNNIRMCALTSIFNGGNRIANGIAKVDHDNHDNDALVDGAGYLEKIKKLENQLDQYMQQLRQNTHASGDINDDLCSCNSRKQSKSCCGFSHASNIEQGAEDSVAGDFDDEEHYKGYDDVSLIEESFNEKKIKLVESDSSDSGDDGNLDCDALSVRDNSIDVGVDFSTFGPDNIKDYINKK